MNENIINICIVKPVRLAPLWFQEYMEHFRWRVGEIPGCRVIDFVQYNHLVGQSPYLHAKKSIEKSHLVIFLPEYPSNTVALFLGLSLEKFCKPTLVLASKEANIEMFDQVLAEHTDIALVERYRDIRVLENDGPPIVIGALKHFESQINAIKAFRIQAAATA